MLTTRPGRLATREYLPYRVDYLSAGYEGWVTCARFILRYDAEGFARIIAHETGESGVRVVFNRRII